MKILITTDVFPPRAGGSGHSTAALAGALHRRGHDVTIVVPRQEATGQTEWSGVAVLEAVVRSQAREADYRDFLGERIDPSRFDLVHAQHWLSATASHQAFPQLPMVVTLRDYWPVCIWSTMLSGTEPCPGCSFPRRMLCVGRRKPWLWAASPLVPFYVGWELERRRAVLRAAAGVVTVSRHVARSLAEAGGVAGEVGPKVEVVPNLLDLRKLASLPSLAEVPEPFLLFVGKLEPNKAPDRLVPILEEAGTDLPLWVAGSGSLESKLRDEARAAGRDVRFLGWTEPDETLRLMRQATAVLFPSRWQEPLSRVLLEALGMGAVLIVEPTGGSEDIVVDEESALLARGAKELGRALARILAEPALAHRLREGARSRAESTFGETSVVPRIEAVYRRAVS